MRHVAALRACPARGVGAAKRSNPLFAVDGGGDGPPLDGTHGLTTPCRYSGLPLRGTRQPPRGTGSPEGAEITRPPDARAAGGGLAVGDAASNAAGGGARRPPQHPQATPLWRGDGASVIGACGGSCDRHPADSLGAAAAGPAGGGEATAGALQKWTLGCCRGGHHRCAIIVMGLVNGAVEGPAQRWWPATRSMKTKQGCSPASSAPFAFGSPNCRGRGGGVEAWLGTMLPSSLERRPPHPVG